MDKSNALVRPKPGEIVPHESVWLANFISKRTRLAYRNAVGEFVAFHGIDTPEGLYAVDQAHVIAWRDALIKAGARERTVNSRIAAVSSLFKHLLEQGAAVKNPTLGVRRPKVNYDRVETPVITPEQVRKTLEAPNLTKLIGLRDSMILHILFFTGCRVSEVCHLKVGDFFEDAGYFVLDFLVKGGKRNRVAIHQELQNAIRRYLSMAGHGNDKDAPLILPVKRKDKVKPLDTRQMNNIFKKYARLAGLPENITPHTARATFITQALERKCAIEAVQRTVGHARISTTQMYDKRIMRHRESASFSVMY